MNGESGAVEARGALLLALRQAGVRNVDVLRAVETVHRENFVPYRLRDLAGRDCPLPIACGQTMEAPAALAAVLEALDLDPAHRVMEIGAGSGYATAMLARLAHEVVSFERFHSLATEARARLEDLGVADVAVHCADGLAEPERYGRFDRIVVHACLPAIPQRLVGALAPTGFLVCALPSAEGKGEDLVLFSAREKSLRRLGASRLGKVLQGVARTL